MSNTFKTVGLITKHGDARVSDTLTELLQFLESQETNVLLDESSRGLIADKAFVSREQISRECDLVIVVGGDGTLLNAARTMTERQVPLLGINLGRLGFLTDISPVRLRESLTEIFAGNYVEEERILLRSTIYRDGEVIARSEAFNDVVIHKWDVARMIEMETYIDGRFVSTSRSDGLIVATPTGSTAYALSGGGPILYPDLNALVLVYICPHTMSNRPIVIDGNHLVEIIVTDSSQSHAQVTCDGQINLGVVSGDRVQIRKEDNNVKLIHPPGHDHFEVLRAKLHWGEKL